MFARVLRAENALLRTELAEARAELTAIREEIVDLNAQLWVSRDECGSMHRVNDHLRATIDALTEERGLHLAARKALWAQVERDTAVLDQIKPTVVAAARKRVQS